MEKERESLLGSGEMSGVGRNVCRALAMPTREREREEGKDPFQRSGASGYVKAGWRFALGLEKNRCFCLLRGGRNTNVSVALSALPRQFLRQDYWRRCSIIFLPVRSSNNRDLEGGECSEFL